MITHNKFDLIINIPKDITRRELTNGYIIQRTAVDFNCSAYHQRKVGIGFHHCFLHDG